MDMKVSKKLGLKERYTMMTRDLGWDTTYQPMDKVFPYVAYEGIKIHDWDKWEDPFRLTMDAYWKYQAEKERKLYAIIDAFMPRTTATCHLTDARYICRLKLFLQAISPPLEYGRTGLCPWWPAEVGAGPQRGLP
jgi:phenol hydroxylase P3 protein